MEQFSWEGNKLLVWVQMWSTQVQTLMPLDGNIQTSCPQGGHGELSDVKDR